MALSFLSFWIILIPLVSSTSLDPTKTTRIDVLGWECTNTTVPDAAAYKQSYQIITKNVKELLQENSFGTHEHGDPPQRMYLLSQCISDLEAAECIMCWSRAADLLSRCLPSTGGRFYLDGCFIRAENYNFYREALSHDDTRICRDDKALPSAEYKELVRQVTDNIVEKAPLLDGFSVSKKANGTLTAYGLGMCWRTLGEELCKLCLTDGVLSASQCLPSKGGSALNTGCYLRYSDHPFYHDRGLANFRKVATEIVAHFSFAAAICASAIAFGFWVGKFIYLFKHKRHRKKEKESRATYDSSSYMWFKYSTLGKATDDFNETCKLGAGGYGEVFKGTLRDGREIAIKRLHVSRKKQLEEIHNEIVVISRCQHKNLVRLLGYCITNMNSFLVYEYLANTSLDNILFHPEKKKELDWKRRLGIVLGTAEGLEYLHKACQVIHRDVKASNILLDLKYRPKISDFGLAKFYPNDNNKNTRSFSIAGTLGYMAPEYISKGTLTDKIDVYSFGVLVLEITSGVRNNKFQSNDSLETLVTQTWKCFTCNNVEGMIDKDMENTNDKEVKRVIQIGLLCTQVSPDLRPPMAEVTKILTSDDIDLPLPTKPPFINIYV